MSTRTSGEHRAIVIYESMFGNTAAIAEAIGAELLADGVEVEVVEVSAAPEAHDLVADLVVLGAPTHAFSLSRPGTRADAVRQGATPRDPSVGLREWLTRASAHPSPQGLPVALFDTRVTRVRRLPGSAARKMAHLAGAAGLGPVVDVRSFYVGDVDGPLGDHELEHARTWARELTTTLGTGAVRS